jgi:small subunit ribosomal protein S1
VGECLDSLGNMGLLRGAKFSGAFMSTAITNYLDQQFQSKLTKPGQLIPAQVIEIGKVFVLLDANCKSETLVPVQEFLDHEKQLTIKVGDTVNVILEFIDNGFGETCVSREKAKKAQNWAELVEKFEKNESVEGIVVDKVKGGFSIELGDLRAFLPGSLVAVRPNQELPVSNEVVEFKIVKMDTKRNNIVVSRKAVLMALNKVDPAETIATLKEGNVIKGTVKNLTDYGAFIDLGGLDGLLHITDMSWKRLKHPSEIVTVGDDIEVKVLSYDENKRRVSLGIKQLQEDPWEEIMSRFPVGRRLSGHINSITDYGCFVEVEDGIEGLVHISELDWTNKNIHPNKVVKIGEELEVQVLGLDQDRRRISFGIKQCKPNPWLLFNEHYKVGDKVKGVVKSITDFGLFIGLENNLDGLVHINDIDWCSNKAEEICTLYKKGDEVETVIISIDCDKERIALSIKQLKEDPYSIYLEAHPKGTLASGTVKEVQADNVIIQLDEKLKGMIPLAQFREEVNINDTIEAYIVNQDRKFNHLIMSMSAPSVSKPKRRTTNLKLSGGETEQASIGEMIKNEMQQKKPTKEDKA